MPEATSFYLPLVCKSVAPIFCLSWFEFYHFSFKECHWLLKDPSKSLGLKHRKASRGSGTSNSTHEDPGGLSSWLLSHFSLWATLPFSFLSRPALSFPPCSQSAEGGHSSNVLIQNPDSWGRESIWPRLNPMSIPGIIAIYRGQGHVTSHMAAGFLQNEWSKTKQGETTHLLWPSIRSHIP